jgi:beta-glucanase (GH16 family)
MRISLKHVVSAAVAILIGLSANVQAESATIPTATIAFSALPKVIFGDPDLPLQLTQNAGITTATSTTPTICSVVDNSYARILSAGVCRITASNPGTSIYKPAKDVTKSFTVSKAPNVVTISDFDWLSMANPTVDITTTETAGVTVLTSTTTRYCTISGNKVTAIKVGTCTIKASNPTSTNYLAAKAVTKSVVIGLTSSILPPSLNYVAPWTIRQTTFNDSNSFNRVDDANAWVANNWYHSGLRAQIAQVAVLSTTKVSYLVTDSLGRPTPNKTINLSVGKRHGGSSASVKVGTLTSNGVDKTPLDQILVTGTTDSKGVVSFDITGLDTVAKAGRYTQLAAWITDLAIDTIDITNLEYSLPAGGSTGGGSTGGGSTGGGVVVPGVKTLLWADEFDGTAGSGPSSTNWGAELGDGCNSGPGCGWGNGEAQAYAACASKLDGQGKMVITASTPTGDANCLTNKTWTSGKFTTFGKKHFTYGYFEASLKMPSGGGTWPAFWTLGSNINTVPWPLCGELDIVEYAGNSPLINTSAAHYLAPSNNHDYKYGALNSSVALSQGYHTYGMLWLPTEVTFYMDGREVLKTKKSDTGLTYWPFGPNSAGVNPKMYVIFNLAMGGSYGGGIQSGLNKATFSIDYFRYYSMNGYGSVTNN